MDFFQIVHCEKHIIFKNKDGTHLNIHELGDRRKILNMMYYDIRRSSKKIEQKRMKKKEGSRTKGWRNPCNKTKNMGEITLDGQETLLKYSNVEELGTNTAATYRIENNSVIHKEA
eukprot:scaffold19735_cov103-Cylindrotheca_fusiformis.AAC.1